MTHGVGPFPLDDVLEKPRAASEAFVNGDARPFVALASGGADFAIFGPLSGAYPAVQPRA